MADLKEKIYSKERISPEEALELFSWDILELGQAARFRCRAAFEGSEDRYSLVGFIIDRIINYTNICEAKCRFCAYHAKAGQMDGYVLPIETILEKVSELVSAGGTQVMLQGGMNPDFGLDYYEDLLKNVKKAFPDIWLHSFSPAEVIFLSGKEGIEPVTVLERLKNAGLDSMPGASDLLVDRIRSEVSPGKLTADQWRRVMHALKSLGMKSSATMTYGMGETLAERISHLDFIRKVQDETGIIQAFIPWSFSPPNTEMSHVVPATGLEYLRIVAVGRIYLDNVLHIQSGWLTEGMKLAQIALGMGANDMGGVLTEELVVSATGVSNSTSMNEIIDIVKNAGRVPVQRDSEYAIIRRFE